MSPLPGDFVFAKHTGEIGRIAGVLVYEWSIEWLDGSTGRLERDDFIPVSTATLWLLATTAPAQVISLVVRAQNPDDED